MATSKSLQPHPNTFQNAPFLNGINHVLRTSGVVTAGWRRKRRNKSLVKTDWKYEQFLEKPLHCDVVKISAKIGASNFVSTKESIQIGARAYVPNWIVNSELTILNSH